MNRLLFAALLAMFMSASWGSNAEPSSTQTNPDNNKKESTSTIDSATEKLKKEHDEFIRKAQDQLGDLNRRIVELRRTARKKSGEAKIRINQEIRLLETEQKEAEKKLAKLQVEIGKKWETLKSDVSDAIERLEKSVEKTRNDMFSNKEDDSH